MIACEFFLESPARAGALLLAWAEERRDRRPLAFGAVTLVLGVVVLALPQWFFPLFYLDVP